MGTGPASHTSPTLLGRLRHDPRDQTAWRAFVARYQPRILGWCRQWGLQPADAEDVAQTVMLKLAAKMQGFEYDPGRSFRGWLRTLAHHAWSDFVEGQRRVGRGETGVLDQLQTVAARDDLTARLNDEFDREILDEAMARVRLQVTPAKWEIFRLTAIDGQSGAEVAAKHDMKVATVYAVRSKIQKLLHDEIQKMDAPAASGAEEAT